MAARPGDGRPSRQRRPGRAGQKPPPIYKPTKTTKGTRHQPGSPTRGGDCCPMIAAGRAALKGKWRLARRHVLFAVGVVAARIGRID